MRIFVIVLMAVVFTRQEEPEDRVEPDVETSFSCEGRITGYYADMETGCRTYHYCSGTSKYTYKCPNNTVFQQRVLICNHWYLVDCETSDKFYDANLLIGQQDKPFVGESGVPTTGTVVRTTPRTTTPVHTTYDRKTTEGPSATTTTRKTFKDDILYTRTTLPPSSSKPIGRTGKSGSGPGKNNPLAGFIRLTLNDPRLLFYIPEDGNGLESVSANPREFVIPRASHVPEAMRFKSKDLSGISCPGYCHPQFLKPGTCHPCITIK